MDPRAVQTLKVDEGCELKAYKCSNGYWTIGHGTNLQTLEIDEELAEVLFVKGLEKAQKEAASLKVFHRLSQVRQDVLTSMAYQMGLGGLQGFKQMLEALERGDYQEAAAEMLNSKWARIDSPARAKRMSKRMATNVW